MDQDIAQPTVFSEPAAPKRRSRFGLLALVFIAVIAGIFYETRPPQDFPDSGGIFTVMPGASLKSIGTDLEEAHYIRARSVFATLVTFLGGEHSISPGDYAFHPGENVIAIAQQIATGNHDLEPIKITIPEGDTVKDIAAVLSKKLPDFDEAGFLKVAKENEGYLFPETYFFYPKTTVSDIHSQMISMFNRKAGMLISTSKEHDRGNNVIVTMASIVEKEAHGEDDRATIAGILWKRLDAGMPLQVDATVAYAAGVQENKLTKSLFAINSPYNTYKYKGLPPGPISNPGLAALTAAGNPAPTDYLYYLHDKNGTIHYAKTYAEHLKNIAKYLK